MRNKLLREWGFESSADVMNPVEWLLSLTDHQLNVLGTMFGVLASIATVFSVIAANYARLARRDAKVARENTATSAWGDGTLRDVPVAELARHAALTGEATRQEVSDLRAWVRGTGRRRLATTEVPHVTAPTPRQESTYE